MPDIETEFHQLVDIVKKLRSEDGCPWDKKQTIVSLKKYLYEEFEELLLAIDKNDLDNLCEETGDFLFLLVMIAQINSESKTFGIDDVISTISKKLIRRHPHVFAGVKIEGEEALRRQWQMIKAQEKSKKN